MNPVIRIHAVPWRRLAIAFLAVATMMAFGVPNADATSHSILITGQSGPSTTETAGKVTFDVSLSETPATTTETVTLAVTSSDLTEGTVSTSLLSFTSANWNTAQTVTVTGIDDDIDDGDVPFRITVSTSSSGTQYATAFVDLTNIDDDTKGIKVSAISGTTGEDGTWASFTVVLESEPTATVTIPVSSSDTSEGTVSTSLLSFTSEDWNTAQTVTVTGIDDDITDGDITYFIDLGAASGDDYAGLDATDVSVTNVDDDTPSISVGPISGMTGEDGTVAWFTVVLDMEPSGSVTIPLSTSDTTEGSVSPTTLMFDASNWSSPRVVSVSGLDDDIADGDVAYSIRTEPASGGGYDGVDASDVIVWNVDDEAGATLFEDLEGLSDEAVAAIETLVDQGITTGTDDTSFSPAMITERWQMALFLTRVLTATGTTLPAGESGFSDLAGYSTEAQTAINQLAILEISTGTSPDEFSPSGAVTRSQMALFLVRTLEAGGVTLPTASENTFTDLAGYPDEVQAAVDVLVSLGITTGTTESTFSPDTELPRWQMALFLTRVIAVIQG